jgi:hypothetical protein
MNLSLNKWLVPTRSGVAPGEVMKSVVLISAVMFGIAEAKAADLRCVDESNGHSWIKSLVVDEEAKAVTLSLKESASPRKVRLIDTKQLQFGEPIYAFNLPPEPGAEKVTNAFKLYKVGAKWRLIDVGLLEIDGVLTLKALGDSTVFACTRGK